VIDLDRMEADLSAALTAEVRPRPAPRTARPAPAPTLAPAPPPPAPSRQRKSRPPAAPVGVIELMELGLVEEADARIAAATDRLDQTTWATMRALLDGRRDAVRMGLDSLARLAQEGVVAALDRAWVLRFWVALEWGTQDERFDALDHCRERAYRFDELAWWGNLTLLLAVMGKQDEAVRAFDQALPRAGSAPLGPDRLDAVTCALRPAGWSLWAPAWRARDPSTATWASSMPPSARGTRPPSTSATPRPPTGLLAPRPSWPARCTRPGACRPPPDGRSQAAARNPPACWRVRARSGPAPISRWRISALRK
jgi:hypothetical protein